MDPQLAQFLAQHRPVAHEEALWGEGTIPLAVTTYLTPAAPPLAHVTSVRGLLRRGDEIMLMRGHDGKHHIFPGGRRESGETILATLRREMLEETGWHIQPEPRLLGFIHYHHLALQPPDFPHRYPDFLQMVFVAAADYYAGAALLDEEYDAVVGFRPVEVSLQLVTEPGQRALLTAAIG